MSVVRSFLRILSEHYETTQHGYHQCILCKICNGHISYSMRKYPLTHVPILALKRLTVFYLFQCEALYSSTLAGSVYFPDATLYDARLESYWSCMVLPTSPEDVSQIVRTIVANNCSFGVRGGGHGVSAYSSSVDEGVTIDFGTSRLPIYKKKNLHAPERSWLIQR